MRAIYWLLAVLYLPASLSAQDYYYKRYDITSGLPTNIIKATTQDSLGYFWIATDEGLLKYDGIHFINYGKTLRSNYLKGFLTTSKGQLIAIGDQDFLAIEYQKREVNLKSIHSVDRVESDTSLSYPKSGYEARDGAIWIAESQSVVKLHKGGFKRYSFDLKDRTPQFIRSFSLFEDKAQNLYTTSIQGSVYRYDPSSNQFTSTDLRFPSNVEFAGVFGDRLLLGTESGVYSCTFNKAGTFNAPQLILPINNVSFITRMDSSSYFIATHEDTHFIASIEQSSYKPFPHKINNINHVYVSNEKDLWIASNDGWILIRKNIFQNPNNEVHDFIESVTEDPESGKIYYATKASLYEYNPEDETNNILLNLPEGYFQSLAHAKDGLWIANAFQVVQYTPEGIGKTVDFSDERRFVTAVFADSQDHIWIAIPGLPQVYKLDKKRSLSSYPIPLETGSEVGQIQEGPDGIYVTSQGKNAYLFFKSHESEAFTNISYPIETMLSDRFEVTSLAFTSSGKWLTSSEGLFLFDKDGMRLFQPRNIGFDQPIKAVKAYDKDWLVLVNAHGLVLYNPQYSISEVFNESYGLPSRTIIPKTLFTTHKGDFWVGTSHGICFTKESLEVASKTLTPQWISTTINGKKSTYLEDQEINFGQLIAIQVSAITFPETDVNYQYRLDGAGLWNFTNPEIVLSDLPAGDHQVEIRAKKFGAHTWSDPLIIHLRIAKPYWEKVGFYLLSILIISLISGITYKVGNRRQKARNRQLTKLVDEKTLELRTINEHLNALNKEKNGLFQILAHDLKNPLNQIIGLSELIKTDDQLSGESDQYLDYIIQVALRTAKMIENILQLNRLESDQIKVKLTPVNFSNSLSKIIDHMVAQAAKKDIQLVRKINHEVYGVADEQFLIQIVENLLSNAIKFTPPSRSIVIEVFERDNEAICAIQDQGPGLTEDDRKKLFGKFQKLSAEPTGDESSTGLGLSIVKKLADVLHARIDVISEPDQGARFEVAFPLSRENVTQVIQ